MASRIYHNVLWTDTDTDEEIEGDLHARLTPEGLIMDFVADGDIIATQCIFMDDLAEMCV